MKKAISTLFAVTLHWVNVEGYKQGLEPGVGLQVVGYLPEDVLGLVDRSRKFELKQDVFDVHVLDT